jgi:tetratricopeptide (TPR) repeat protein
MPGPARREDFVALRTPGHSVAAYPADPWADTAPARVLVSVDAAYTPAAFGVLVDTAARWPHLAQRQLYPLLRARPVLAPQAGGTALANLAALPDLDLDVLAAIVPYLPAGSHVDLDAGIAQVTVRLAMHELARTTDPLRRADVYLTLGYRLANAGRPDGALDASTQGLAGLLSPYAPTDPDALAAELRQAGEALETLERTGQLQTASPVVQGYLARVQTNHHQLVRMLYNFGAHLDAAGRWAEALDVTAQVVRIHRWSSTGRPDPDLARALTALGTRLAAVGRLVEALPPSQEAVDLYRRLALTDPEPSTVDLAAALSNLAGRLWELDRPAQALPVMEEAADVYRRLARADPDTHAPAYARAMAQIGRCLTRTGRLADGVTATEDALRAYRRLARANERYTAEVATALNDLSISLSQLGRNAEALAAAEEAVEVYRPVAAAHPDGSAFDFAALLANLGQRLSDNKREPEAIERVEEAVAIYRRLLQASPGAVHRHLAQALFLLGGLLIDTGNQQRGQATWNEAIRLQ